MLRLPAFLSELSLQPDATQLADGFVLTGFFLNRYAFEQTGKPRLIRLGLWVGGIAVLLSALVWGLRRRRRARTA